MKRIALALLAALLVAAPASAQWDSSTGSGTGDMTKAIYDTGNDGSADTANALRANGANCSAGQAPLGVDAAGAVEGCYAVGDIGSVTAGDGLTGGGTVGALTMTVGAGLMLDVAADTVDLDYTEAEDATWGDGSVTGGSLIWTFDIGSGTDPVWTISDGVMNLSAGALQIGGVAVGTGSVATDAIFDAAGDLVQGTGANTSARLAIGADNTILKSTGTAAEWSSTLDIATLDMTSSTSSIPWVMGTGTAPTTEGHAYHNTTTDILTIGDGAAAQQMYGAKTGSITSAQLLGSLTNETGTGVAVFGTAPTITFPNSTSLPGTCTVGEQYIDTDADTDGSLYICRATNTWKEVDDDGGAGGAITALYDCTTGDCNSVNVQTGEDLVIDSGATFTVSNGATFNVGAAGVKISDDGDGAITFLGQSAGNDEDLTINLDDTSNTVVLSSSTGVTLIDAGALGFASTGIVSGGVGVITKSADYTLGTDAAREAYGYLVTMTATGTVTLPAVAIGMSVCVYSTTAAAVHVDTNANDRIILNGTALADGDKVSSASAAGDFICLVGESANGWLTMGRSGTWTDGN